MRVSSTDPVPPLDPRYPDPTLWARLPRVLESKPGHHRFLWDMQYPQVPGMSTGPDADLAVPYNTPQVSTAPWAMPGTYTVKLTGGGHTETAQLTVVMDPRVKTPVAELQAQFDISKTMYDSLMKATAALHEIAMLREQLHARAGQAPVAAADQGLQAKLDAIAGGGRGGRGGGGGGRGAPAGPPNLNTARAQAARMEHEIQKADEAPTTAQVMAAKASIEPIDSLVAQWNQLKATDLKALNQQLEKMKLATLKLNTFRIDHDVEDQIELGDIN